MFYSGDENDRDLEYYFQKYFSAVCVTIDSRVHVYSYVAKHVVIKSSLLLLLFELVVILHKLIVSLLAGP